jgi:membrane protein implicated in regulation of membrane protease activity
MFVIVNYLDFLLLPTPTKNGKITEEAPFFSRARFGPGMITILIILVFLVAVTILSKLYYLAILAATVAIGLFTVKYFEQIQSGKAEERKLIGQTCLVLKKVTASERGVVKVYTESGRLDPELWSAELASKDAIIEEGKLARIVGTRGIILLIEPL